jgi:hypothetical protein
VVVAAMVVVVVVKEKAPVGQRGWQTEPCQKKKKSHATYQKTDMLNNLTNFLHII